MSNLFWLTEAQMARLQPFFPKSHGMPRVDDRRGQRAAANMMLVRRNSGVPISLACSRLSAGNSLDHGIAGTASLGGPLRTAVRAGNR